jgi:hypothetical protein
MTVTVSNVAPTADAGADQTVTDTDDSGAENVTLDGSGSSDSDGTISSYVWEEDSSQIATGSGPTVSFDVGSHTVTLTVTDDDSATDDDTVIMTVNAAPSIYEIDCDTDDQVVRDDDTFRGVSTTTGRVGHDQSGLDGSYVMVFALPTLAAGETVTDANLDIYLATIRDSMTFNADLYGLPYRSTSSVVVGDFYEGVYDGDSGATALQNDICTPSMSTGALESNSTGDSNLATYLAAQYTAGAEGGDYVFIRVSPDTTDAPNYKYYQFTTADGATASERPVLTITTSGGQ